MGRTYKVGPSGSFGARYGTVARKRYATVISGLRAHHECPQCHITAVRRLSVGIWLCGSCGYKFAGGAYAPRTKLGEIAERATRTGVAPSLVSELKASAEPREEAKTGAKKRRKRIESGKKAKPSEAEKVTENKTE
jgi:large subunit ribosomal protein L37Ae